MDQEQPIGQHSDGTSSRDQREIDSFSALADQWWDSDGPFAPLHRLNPTRVKVIADLCASHFSRDLNTDKPFSDTSLWDVGCGGGLVSEPMSKLGFKVTGMDASPENISAAQFHASASCLSIDYHVGAPEDVSDMPHQFDVILALEVVEHVANIDVFIDRLTKNLAPDGLLILSTISRSLKSMAMAKVAAEYLLRWVPPGTHTWSKFVTPSELARHIRTAGCKVVALNGLGYDLATGEWKRVDDVSVNYVLAATPN